MLKFGQLYLDNGKYQGDDLVSESWVEESTERRGWIPPYGYLWWPRINPFSDYDYAARGHGGQIIMVSRDKNAVVVVTAATQDQIAFDLAYDVLSDAVTSDEKLDSNPRATARLQEYIESLQKPSPIAVQALPEIPGIRSMTLHRFHNNY